MFSITAKTKMNSSMHTNQDVVELVPHESGQHYLDLKKNEKAGIALVTMVTENFEGYTK